MSESSLHCQTSFKSQNGCAHACHDGLFCSGIMVERFIFFSNLDGRNSRSQKNNYNFDKMTVVEIQEGSKYWSNYGIV